MKRYNKRVNNLKLVLIFMIFISISFISIGYSALNSNLTISGEAEVTGEENIFISNIQLINSIDSSEIYDPEYTETTTTVGMNSDTKESLFTYEVTITNTTNNYYYLSDIIEHLYKGEGIYVVVNLYLFDEFAPKSETTFQIEYGTGIVPTDSEVQINLEYVFVEGERYKDPILNGADPVLIDGVIPIVYNEDINEWIKADVLNNEWYNYNEQKWANAASVINAERINYVEASPGTVIEMDHITSMLVWIPRYSYTIRDKLGYYGFGANQVSLSTPGAIDIKFIGSDEFDNGTGEYTGLYPSNYYTPSGFCWGNSCDNPETRFNEENTEVNGFWIAKFEASRTDDLLYSRPNQKPLTNYTIAQSFYMVQNLMNGMNGYFNYGYIGYVDAHLIKNTEWGAIAYLSQSAYGKYGNVDYTGVNKEIYLNNCSTYVTGIGGSSASDGRTTVTCTSSNHTYETYNGMGASTTGNIYGVYDMLGGTFDRVMGVLLAQDGSFDSDLSGFTSLPEGRYINVYPFGTYTLGDVSPIKGDALTETINYYDDRYLNDPRFSGGTDYYAYHWFYRGGSLFFPNTDANGIFSYTLFSGVADSHHASRYTIIIY